jgi:hypothetical protein
MLTIELLNMGRDLSGGPFTGGLFEQLLLVGEIESNQNSAIVTRSSLPFITEDSEEIQRSASTQRHGATESECGSTRAKRSVGDTRGQIQDR